MHPAFVFRRTYAILLQTIIAVIFSLSLALPAIAVEPDEVLKDPKLEARARALSAQLRCLVCQNQSIDDSDAPLARDLRILVRDRLKKGDSDAQVLDYVVARYGEFALLRPTFGMHTLLLWLTPLLVLSLALWFVWIRIQNSQTIPAERTAELTEEEKEALKKLVKR